MAEALVTLDSIVNNLKQVANELLPTTTVHKNGKESKKDADPLIALASLRKCVEDLALFVQKDKIKERTQETTIKEHEDEIDHLKQKNLKGKIIITSKSQYGECLIKTEAQLQQENKSLAEHVIDLVNLKYSQVITKEDIGSCFRLKKGGVLVKFAKKGKGSQFHTLSSKIKSSQGAKINLYMNFMMTARRGELLFEIRKLKKDGRIKKFYSDEEGNISIKLNVGENIIRVTDVFNEGSKKLRTWTLDELYAAC